MTDDPRQLVVLLGGHRVGTVTMDATGRLALAYDPEWLTDPRAIPVSLSMPLVQRAHDDGPTRAYLSGLLPDNERVLERWGRDYHVSPGNPFALLRHVGEDCAGAAQLVRPERVTELSAGEGGVHWLAPKEIADRLRVLRRDPAAWHVYGSGQFSLAGAQAKTALYRDPTTGQWGEPWGATPTTHILKPAIAGLDDHDLNEHLCLSAAHDLGLPAARSTIESFEGERAVVVERYDRGYAPDGSVTRLHQEDICQAMGILPTSKYQNEGGPTPEQIVHLLRTNILPPAAGRGAVDVFVDALAFNWLIGGSDAHAKNYSLLLAPGTVRLAPLYDLASALAYDEIHLPRLAMAMKIGGEYRMAAVAGRHWRRFAESVGLDPQAVLDRVDRFADEVPGAFRAAADNPAVRALETSAPARLAQRIARNAAECRERLRQ